MQSKLQRRLNEKSRQSWLSKRFASHVSGTLERTLQAVQPSNAPFTDYAHTKDRQTQIEWDYMWRRLHCWNACKRKIVGEYFEADNQWLYDTGYCIDRYSTQDDGVVRP